MLFISNAVPDGPAYPSFESHEKTILSLRWYNEIWIVSGNEYGKFSITGSTVENSGIPVGCFASRIAALFDGEIESLGLSDDFFRRTLLNEPEDAYTSGCLSATAYPNPFGASTTIRYRVSTPANVRLKLYDMLGRELRTLVDEHHEEGTYERRLDGRTLAAGVYIYRLEIGGERLAGQVVLVK